MSDLTCYQRNRDVILNRAKDYYEDGKERLREHARYKHRNLSEEQKKNRENMGKWDTTICLKKKKQRLKEYQKNYHQAKKYQYNNE